MHASRRERAASALAALGVVLLAAYVLVIGLNAGAAVRGHNALVAVFVAPPPPPQEKREAPRPERAAPHDDPARPTPKAAAAAPVFVPRLPPLVVSVPIAAAPQPAAGEADAGGGDGAGEGGGGGGNGSGDGAGDGVAVEPRQIRGRLSSRDLPDGMLAPGDEVRVGVRYIVETDGRVSDCHAHEPSGLPALDALACRLIEKRYRFRPARDRAGHAVRATIVEGHNWFVRDKQVPAG